MDVENALQQTLESEIDHLRRELRSTIADCNTALGLMEAGHRPASSISAPLLSSAVDVEKRAARVEMLLNWAGSPMLTNEAAIAALQGTAAGKPDPECRACQMGGTACHNHREGA